MAKTQKERAFLRELDLNDTWTRRFTDLADKHLKFSGDKNLLYVNTGTGNHVMALREKIGGETAIFATCEDEEILAIAHDKAIAVKADVDFSMLRFEDDAFDAVLTDASFLRSDDLSNAIEDSVRVAESGGKVGVMLVAAGSFGEIFSLLWEVLFNEDLGEHGTAAETVVRELPTISQIEEIAERAGLVNIKTYTANEIFEYENGGEFINAPLVADFLLPAWLKTLDENEKEQVSEKLAQLIDAEDGTLTFRFTVKAMLLVGEKG